MQFENLNFMWIIAFVLCALYIFLYITNKSLDSKKIILISIITTIIVLGLCLTLIPPNSFDLFRHFDDINYFRNCSFDQSIDAIFSKANFIWRIILYLISLLPSNYFIFLFTIPITLGIYFYILFKIINKYNLSTRRIVLCILVFFSIVNGVHLMSGIRNALAVAIFSLGLYLMYFENKKLVSIILYTIAMLIHPMIIILIFFIIFSKLFIKIKYVEIVLLMWPLLANIILCLIRLIPIPLFELIAERLSWELTTSFGMDLRIFIFEIIQTLIFLILLFRLKVQFKDNKFVNFLYYLTCFVVGSIPLVNIFIRTRFIYAYFFPLLICMFLIKCVNKFNFEKLLFLISTIIFGYYVYFMLSNGVFM